MRITILPKTPLGWWSVGLVIAIIVLFMVVPEVTNRPLEVAASSGFACLATAALVTGLISIIKNKEPSILVFLTTAIGLLALIIAVGQAFGKTIGW
jgi:membrane-associated HD superfamily phosphohydrolase